MILLTLERKYLKVEQSFAQSSFISKASSLSVEDGMAGRSGCHVTPIMLPCNLQHCSRSSYLHIFISSCHTLALHCNENHKTTRQDKYQLSNRIGASKSHKQLCLNKSRVCVNTANTARTVNCDYQSRELIITQTRRLYRM